VPIQDIYPFGTRGIFATQYDTLWIEG
jgi:hypothetical protein